MKTVLYIIRLFDVNIINYIEDKNYKIQTDTSNNIFTLTVWEDVPGSIIYRIKQTLSELRNLSRGMASIQSIQEFANFLFMLSKTNKIEFDDITNEGMLFLYSYKSNAMRDWTDELELVAVGKNQTSTSQGKSQPTPSQGRFPQSSTQNAPTQSRSDAPSVDLQRELQKIREEYDKKIKILEETHKKEVDQYDKRIRTLEETHRAEVDKIYNAFNRLNERVKKLEEVPASYQQKKFIQSRWQRRYYITSRFNNSTS